MITNEATASNTTPSPFHEGEQAVQSRMGVRESIEAWASQVVRPVMPAQHREFYAQLPFMVAAARDAQGNPWVTLLTGRTGFVQSPQSDRLDINTTLAPGDALETSLADGSKLGLLGIELETRRRNRINGTVSHLESGGFSVNVDQSFGNCPQYISARTWQTVAVDPTQARCATHQHLDAHMRAWISNADTLFIGSGYNSTETTTPARSFTDPSSAPQRCSPKHYGMDASHRGGAPGFVDVVSDTQLVLPDYAGNNHYNTIGNLVMDPRVGLLFVDFEQGSLLQLSGHVSIDWDSAERANYPGAQRLLNITIERIVQLDNVLPLRWSAAQGAARELRVAKKTVESADVTSFEFIPRDGGILPTFKAGQHLPIELQTSDEQIFRRTYSLSNAAGNNSYRISVKRHDQGTVSRLLHDVLEPGNIISSMPPDGTFTLLDNDRDVVLISAGVGITPMVSMLHELADDDRSVHFIHGARDGEHYPLADEVNALAAAHNNIQRHILFSQPRHHESQAHARGRLDGQSIACRVPGLDAEFYLCGPTQFLSSLVSQLKDLGVEDSRIHFENF